MTARHADADAVGVEVSAVTEWGSSCGDLGLHVSEPSRAQERDRSASPTRLATSTLRRPALPGVRRPPKWVSTTGPYAAPVAISILVLLFS